MTSFSEVLIGHASGSAPISATTMPLCVNNNDTQLAMRIHLINHAARLRRLADNQLKIAQKRYKSDDDRKVRIVPTYAANYYVFVGRSLLTTSATKHLAAEGYSKLIPRKHIPYRVLSAGPE